MKRLIVTSSFVISLVIASVAYAQATCTTYANGQVVCVPSGGQPSQYR